MILRAFVFLVGNHQITYFFRYGRSGGECKTLTKKNPPVFLHRAAMLLRTNSAKLFYEPTNEFNDELIFVIPRTLLVKDLFTIPPLIFVQSYQGPFLAKGRILLLLFKNESWLDPSINSL